MQVKIITACIISLMIFSSVALAAQDSGSGPSFDQYEWTEVLATDLGDNATQNPPAFPPFWPGVGHWDPRAGRLFVIGGRSPIPNAGFASIIHGDVWASDDLGQSWENLLDDPFDALQWPNRAYHEAVTLGNYMYIMGGQNFEEANCPPGAPPPCFTSVFFNDVWRSTDGANWQEMKGLSPNEDESHWQARAGLSAVSFNGMLWVMGGSQGDDPSIGGSGRTLYNDVWYSTDGSEWNEATAEIDKTDPEIIWEPRAGAVALVKGDWLYILGGERAFLPGGPGSPDPYFNDVWRTQDGTNWEEVTGETGAGWSPRPGHGCAVLDDHFVCMGGFGFTGNPSDVWVSENGDVWEQVSDSPWNNDPSPDCVEDSPAVTCDNIRYDFDILTVEGGEDGMTQYILTFGGDREQFAIPPDAPPADNWKRIENDVWRFSAGTGNGTFNIDASFGGNWWSGPSRNGEGAQIEVADAGDGDLVFVATIYSYDTEGNQIFLVAVGTVDGDTVDVEVFITQGGMWGDAFDPDLVDMPEWGTGTITGINCDSLHMELKPNATYMALGYTDVMLDLIRLTTPLIPCPIASPN
jgi:hypothetical protein